MRIPILIAAASALAACPLQAQLWAPPGDGLPKAGGTFQASPSVGALHDAGQAIRQGRREGELTRVEAKQLRREQRILGAIAERYAEDGLTPGEAADLDFRAHVLLDQVHAKRTRR
jgi:hypothetical protein